MKINPIAQEKIMTIKMPKKNIIDRVLEIIGKKRETVIPENTGELYRKFGPYIYIMAKKEMILKTLYKKRR